MSQLHLHPIMDAQFDTSGHSHRPIVTFEAGMAALGAGNLQQFPHEPVKEFRAAF